MYVFLFTDIEGSSKLWEEHTPVMTGIIARHDEILRELVTGHGGRITKHTGDGITAAFEGGEPVACALEAQVRFAAEPWGEIGALPIRAGLHAGEAEYHASAGTPDGDFFGPPVNATARVMSAAWGGQILLTPEVTETAPLPELAKLLDLGEHLLKNVSAPQHLYQLLHPNLTSQEFPPPRTLSGQSIRQAVEEQGEEMAGLEPQAMGIALLSATLLPALRGELDPESGALESNLGVLEDMGALSLREFVAGFAERLRADKALPAPELRALLQGVLQTQWQATALRADASQLLQAVHGVEAAMTAATGEVKEALARGLADLSAEHAEFRWMLAGVQDTLADVRTDQALQLALQREQLDLQRQQLVKTNLILQRQPLGATAPPPEVPPEMAVPEDLAPAAVHCPYKGLAAFEAEDAEYFFGREELVAELTARLAGTRFLAVVGPSGSGKSSVVRAGLLPEVWAGALPGSEDWQTLVLTPGAHPLNELAVRLSVLAGDRPAAMLRDLEADHRALELTVRQALADAEASGNQPAGVKLLLIVDQFEEVFALCHDEAERRQFVDALLYAVEAEEGRVVVVPTIRADFYGRCADYPRLAARMSDGLLVGPMSEEELRAAIEEPASVVGLRLEAGLTDVILDDVAGEPGALPLLSHALLETFERRRGIAMTLSGYAAAGGLAGAIAQTADAVYGELNAEEQALARSIFLRMTELGEESAQDTRRRVAPAELVRSEEEAPAIEALLRTLADARLITTSENRVEVAHEALIREWPTLQGWLEEDREGLRVHRHLTVAVGEWERLERDPGELYRGARLATADEWAEAHEEALNPLEREFLAASKELAWRREAEMEAQRQRELEAARALAAEQEKRADIEQRRAEEQAASAGRLRRRALLLAGAMAIAVILAVAAVFAFHQASQNAQEAQAEALSRATAQAVADAAAVEASEQRDVAQAESLSRATAQAVAEAEAEARATQQAVAEAQKAIAESEAQARATQQAVAEQKAREALEAYSLSLAANAQEALNDKDPVTALVLALAANDIEDPPRAAQATLLEAAFSPGPRRRYVTEELFGMEAPSSVDISADGRTALVGFWDGTIIHFDLESEAEIRRFVGHDDVIDEVAFSPDGIRALSASDDGTVIIWDVATGQQVRRFEGHVRRADSTSFWVDTAVFSPDGRQVISTATNVYDVGDEGVSHWVGDLILWEVDTGREIRRLEGIRLVRDLAFSSDGRFIVAGLGFLTPGAKGGWLLWEVGDPEAKPRIEELDQWEAANSVAISPDGRTALVGTMTGRILVWDLVDWELLDVLEGVHSTETSKVAFIPSSRLALSSAESGSLILWNLDTAEPVADFQVHTEWARGFALSPDGRRALSRSWEEGTLILWDLFGADEIGRFEGHTAAVSGLDFAPDGQHLFSSAGLNNLEPFLEEEYTLRLWDLETGEQTGVVEVRPEHEGAGWVYAALSPDGRTALTGGTDNLVRLWDLETGEEVRRLEGHTDWVWGSAISPDGRQALTGAYYRDPTLILWDLESGEIVDRLNATDGAEDVTFSPDGRNALTCHPYDQTLILWDLESGEQVRRFVGHEGELSSVDFTPDGRRAVSGGWDGALILWDVATGQEIRRLTTPEVWIHETKVTPDGRYALAGFSDGTLIMWDLESGEVARQLYGHLGGIHAIAISPDGRTAASGGEDFTIIHWRLTTPELDELRDWVEASRYVRELTCEERKTYQIEPLCVAEVAEREATPEPATGGMKAPERTKHTAQVGENRGEIVLGDFDIWLYEGQAGENLTLRLIADNPANYTTQEQRLELGLLDAYLVVIAPDGSLMASNDDAEAEEFTTDSAIEGLELPEDGIYRIEARSYADLTEGAYTLVIELVESPGE